MFTIEGKNLMLNAFAGGAIWLGLVDSTNTELATARKSITWQPAADGVLECTNTFTFTDLPPDADISKVIFMDSETGGNRLGEETATGVVSYNINSIEVTL